MKIKVGEKIPTTDFFHIDNSGAVKKVKSTELLAKQKAILIGVPGAFTKVCSAKHLPGYVNNFEEAKKKGITKILCISVNDPNVMKAWGENQNVGDKIFMAADPYCEFTKAIGAEIDRTERGLGIRSARYTMLVEDNVIKIIKAEEDTAIPSSITTHRKAVRTKQAAMETAITNAADTPALETLYTRNDSGGRPLGDLPTLE